MSVKQIRGKWQVRVKDNDGRWFPRKAFDRKADAQAYERELWTRRSKGVRADVLKTAEEMTFTDLWTRWSVECRVETSKGWRISQDQMMRDHIAPVLGKLPLSKIARDEIFTVMLKAREKGLGAQMGIHLFALMRQIFQYAVEELEILQASPVRKKFKPKRPKVVRAFMKPEEARRFLEYVADDYCGVAIWIMMSCGLRIGEVQGLQWKNVDLQSGTIFIERQWNRKVKEFTPPKNGDSERVQMPPELIEYLASKKPIGVDPAALVVSNRLGQVVHYDTIQDGLERLCKTGRFTRLAPHELRHSCSELWIEAGATKEDVRRQFNQKSEAAINSYIHRTPERLERLAPAVQLRPPAPHLRRVK